MLDILLELSEEKLTFFFFFFAIISVFKGNFDDCNLTNARVIQSMCTPGGVLYSKEAILKNLLAQKRENKRKLRLWEEQEQNRRDTEAENALVEEEERKEAFLRAQEHRSGAGAGAGVQAEAVGSSGGEPKGTGGESMRAFWLPSKTPEASVSVGKPSMVCRCPASGKKLKLKDLFSVTFARDPEDASKYIDPITKDELSNKDTLVVIRTSGTVMKKKTYEKLVKPDGILNGAAVSEKDVIELQKGGTGFAAHDKNASAKKHYSVGMGSGLADLRGQNASASSRFGLSFAN